MKNRAREVVLIKNIGRNEKVVRLVLGVVFLILGYWPDLPFWEVMIAFFLAAFAIVTGLMNFCPLWMIFGINTDRPRNLETKGKA